MRKFAGIVCFAVAVGAAHSVSLHQAEAQEGKIVVRPVKGGVMLYLPEEVASSRDSADEALKKMGL